MGILSDTVLDIITDNWMEHDGFFIVNMQFMRVDCMDKYADI